MYNEDENMTIDGDIKNFLLKIPVTANSQERNFYIQQCIDQFPNVYGYLESRSDYSEKDLSEGNENIFNTFAQGYWTAGFVAGEIFWGFAARLYSLWIIKAFQFQERHKKRRHKGMAYNQLGWIHFNYYKNNARAYEYYLYALIEDIISERQLYSSPAFQALTTSLFELPKEKVFTIQEEISRQKINKMVPEEVITKINKNVAIPTYEEISNVDIQGLGSLIERWENLKKEHKKIKKT